MKKLLRTVSLALLVVCGAGFGAAGDARADVKIKTKNTSSGQSSEQVTYIKGKRQRTEQSAASVLITQCDLRRTLQLGVPTKTYLMTPFDQKLDANATAAAQSPTATQQAARRGGIVTSTFTSTDTGERKKMFGYTARHIKTSIVTESSPDACQVSRSRMETDGWYIDAAFALDCDYAAGMSFMRSTEPGGCRDQYRSKQVGVAKLGYPVMVTTTLFDDNGQASYTFTQEVLEISNAVLDNALFEAPADYRQVSDYREIYGMPAANNANNSDNDAAASSTAGGASGSGAAKSSSPVSTKRAGVVRVGVPMTMTGLTGDNVNADALAEAVRRALMSNLNNATIEVVTLEAQQPQEAESEAKAKECDYVLYSTVAHKKGGGGGGGFGGFLKKSAAIASGAVAPTSDGGSGGAASSLKAKDELTLEYKLQRGEERLLANTIKAKAKSDGEDLISQLAGQAAAAVRAAATATK